MAQTQECRDCGVQLRPDGSVDNLPESAPTHYTGCGAIAAIDTLVSHAYGEAMEGRTDTARALHASVVYMVRSYRIAPTDMGTLYECERVLMRDAAITEQDCLTTLTNDLPALRSSLNK